MNEFDYFDHFTQSVIAIVVTIICFQVYAIQIHLQRMPTEIKIEKQTGNPIYPAVQSIIKDEFNALDNRVKAIEKVLPKGVK